MPTVKLPHYPSLENLRKRAKSLHRNVRAGDESALATVREFHAQASHAFSLSDAQLVVARQHGFASWTKMKDHVETVLRYARRPDTLPEAQDPADEFCRLACLMYGGDTPIRRNHAAGMLEQHPEIATANIWAASAAGDVDGVRRHIADVRTLGGPYDWEPLMYAAYSRVNGAGTLAVARVLLEAGADPNAGYLWDGVNAFTALTGAFGEGEQGPVNQPRHEYSLELARLLLDAGADPNDDQTLYNRQFRPDNDHLELLLEYGLGKTTNGPWHQRLGSGLNSAEKMLNDQVLSAARLNFIDRVRLLVERGGADVGWKGSMYAASGWPSDGVTAYEIAVREGNTEIAEYLASRGAAARELSPVDVVCAAVLAADRDSVRKLASQDPGVIEQSRQSAPNLVLRAVLARRPDAIRLAAELGFDVNGFSPNSNPTPILDRSTRTPLHEAAWSGEVEIVKLLVELGADPSIKEPAHGDTPLDWARYADQPEVVAYLDRATERYAN